MPSPASLTSNPSLPTPRLAPPPPKVGMVSGVKLSVFKGVGNEERGQLWFIVGAIWESQRITHENIKNATSVSTLQDRALTCYIKYSSDHLNAGITAIKYALDKEFN